MTWNEFVRAGGLRSRNSARCMVLSLGSENFELPISFSRLLFLAWGSGKILLL